MLGFSPTLGATGFPGSGTTERCATEPMGIVEEASFGQLPDGTNVSLFTLQNAQGFNATITNYGGVVTSLKVPDRHGRFGDVVLGFSCLQDYVEHDAYVGALIGRYANRIANGAFRLRGVSHRLTVNDGPHSNHGGIMGFDKVLWSVGKAGVVDGSPTLTLMHVSGDGQEGYPGNLNVSATYTLTADNALRLEMIATTDQPTLVNLTHHSYFNLRGFGDVLDHELQIHAQRFTPVDSTLIPTGELREVAGTAFDFRSPVAIGARIDQPEAQLQLAGGYDHNWVIDRHGEALTTHAEVYEPQSGRVMQVISNQPGLQFYSGNFLNGRLLGKSGVRYATRSGLCLEPQHFPDSPNQPHFPSSELAPGETYRHTLLYRFSNR